MCHSNPPRPRRHSQKRCDSVVSHPELGGFLSMLENQGDHLELALASPKPSPNLLSPTGGAEAEELGGGRVKFCDSEVLKTAPGQWVNYVNHPPV